MANLLSRRSGPMALVAVLFAAVVIGCGGGGGGGGTSGGANNGGSNAGSNSGNNGGTTASAPGLTSGSDGTLSGQLPQNSVFYAINTTTDPLNPTYDVRYVKPDGTTGGTYEGGVAAGASPASPDPSQANAFVFAAKPAGNSKYGIYRNTTASINGATLLVGATFAEILSVQVARDGTKVVFVASTTTGGATQLYVASAGNTVATAIDAAESAYLSSDGTKVVYSKYPDGESDTELYVRFLTPADTASTRLTTNGLYDDDPQFSKDGSKVVFAESLPGGSSRERLASLSLTAPYTITTFDPVPTSDLQRAPSFNGDGTKVSFVVISSVAGASGVWTSNLDGSSPQQVVSSDLLQSATYWSTPQGRSLSSQALGWSPGRRR